MSLRDFKAVEPKTLEEAIERKQALVDKIQEIDVQLGNRNKLIGGQRASSNEFWDWRRKALHAKQYLLLELRYLKSWIYTHHSGIRFTSQNEILWSQDKPKLPPRGEVVYHWYWRKGSPWIRIAKIDEDGCVYWHGTDVFDHLEDLSDSDGYWSVEPLAVPSLT